MTASWVLALLPPALVSAACIELLRRSRLQAVLRDVPNERSLHAEPTPRVGGLGILLASLPIAAYLAHAELATALLMALALGVVSLADDRRSLPVWIRLAAHLAAAVMVVLPFASAWGVAAALAAVLAIAWMTNLFNFMDGADGLAGGMGVAGFGAYAIAAAGANDMPLALACATFASACAGFLLHNFPPARVFLGDAGSVPLGFLAGALGAYGIASSSWAWWFPLVVFAPFIIDATLTLLRRAFALEPLWHAHRSHAYQRLALSGWSHRRLALTAYAAMALSSLCALAAWSTEGEARFGIISAWAFAAALAFLALERSLARAHSSPDDAAEEQE
jgi:UDP-N-acetylmuramyl pentapeptide phosphotransferase/UDP-N-acetylglucosamine-1-phosphate transferase